MTQWRWKDRAVNALGMDEPSSLFMGTDAVRGNLCVCPALNVWIGAEMHKEAQSAKEVRK